MHKKVKAIEPECQASDLEIPDYHGGDNFLIDSISVTHFTLLKFPEIFNDKYFEDSKAFSGIEKFVRFLDLVGRSDKLSNMILKLKIYIQLVGSLELEEF